MDNMPYQDENMEPEDKIDYISIIIFIIVGLPCLYWISVYLILPYLKFN